MLHNLDAPPISAKGGKHKYKQFLREHKLETFWEQRHTRAFLKLKQILLTEPVLKAPIFDGTPFIVISDDCRMVSEQS
ncbi:hypothetical protein P692DRAFT_201723394 [Suillus brevipes Sb2]|nr:hypothetical protein P692DRAFT_201723394 [Suillus brevipes Sb2]